MTHFVGLRTDLDLGNRGDAVVGDRREQVRARRGLFGEPAQDPQHGRRVRVGADEVVLGAGLGAPERGGVRVALREVVQVEAVGGGPVPGAGRVLPPEAGAALEPGEVQGAAEGPGDGRLGELVGDEVGEPVGGAVQEGGLAQRVEGAGGAGVAGDAGGGRLVVVLLLVGDDVAGDAGVAQQQGLDEEVVDGGRHGVVAPGSSRWGTWTSSAPRAWWSRVWVMAGDRPRTPGTACGSMPQR
ncbi:hypothetical protein Saa2_09358 [Streptomyces acidiscabies]|nr:hypothetical protein Saa2_09358 [Streptomyces acidiscabies]